MIYLKNSFIAITALLFSFNALAQTTRIPVALKWGKEHETIEKFASAETIGFDKTNLFTTEYDLWTSKLATQYLLKYDAQFNQLSKVKVELSQGDKDYFYESFFMTQSGELFLLTSYADESKKISTLYSQTIDKATLKPKGDFNKILEIPYAKKFRSDNLIKGTAARKGTGSIVISYSSDSSKIAIISKADLKDKANETYAISVLDNNMRVLWSKTSVLPYNNELFDMMGFDFNNEGEVYLLGKLYNEKKKEQIKDKPNYQFLLFNINATKEKEEVINIDTKGAFVTNLKVSINKNNDVVCVGLYSKQGVESVLGTYVAIVDGKTKKVKNVTQQKFEFEFITEFYSDTDLKQAQKHQAKGEEIEMKRFTVRNIYQKTDGSFILTAEQGDFAEYSFLNTSRLRYNAVDVKYDTYQQTFYEDILIVSMDKDGKIEWKKTIPKKQVTSDDRDFSVSFASVLKNDKIYILLNESESNCKKNRFVKNADLGYLSPLSRHAFLLYCFDTTGNLSSKVLKSKPTSYFVVIPKSLRPINVDQLLVVGRVGKKQNFGWLTFGEEEKDE
jgi:hypothetical protein